MVEPRHLANAPITEAVLDIRVKQRPEFAVSEFEKLGSAIDDRFVSRKPLFHGSIQIDIGAEGPVPKMDREPIGFQFWSKDSLDVASFRKDGFSVSRLKPYTDWPDVFER